MRAFCNSPSQTEKSIFRLNNGNGWLVLSVIEPKTHTHTMRKLHKARPITQRRCKPHLHTNITEVPLNFSPSPRAAPISLAPPFCPPFWNHSFSSCILTAHLQCARLPRVQKLFSVQSHSQTVHTDTHTLNFNKPLKLKERISTTCVYFN